MAMSRGGETFVLNMGTQIKIFDMAKQLIWLSGHEPDEDIDIAITGLRPGEKLFEELIIEDVANSSMPEDIFIAKSAIESPNAIIHQIEKALKFARERNVNASIAIVKELSSWRSSGSYQMPEEQISIH